MIGGMNEWQVLAEALNRTMASYAPGWTNRNDVDPGITVLQVIAYLADGLLVYRQRYDDEDPVSVRTTDLETHVPLAESWSGTKRPNYLSGRLRAGDLTEEQNYLLETHRRHLRTLHGFGIVHGLEVGAGAQGDAITIEPGLAIDARGREVQLNERLTLLVPKDTASPVFVAVEYSERFVDPVPVGKDATSELSRIEDGCRVVLADGPCESGVAVARLIKEQDAWRVDPSFAPARAN